MRPDVTAALLIGLVLQLLNLPILPLIPGSRCLAFILPHLELTRLAVLRMHECMELPLRLSLIAST